MTFAPDDLQFEVALRYDYGTEQVLAAPRGDLDILNADDFRRVLDAAIEGRTTLVVDLVDLDFCDAAGSRVLAEVGQRLADGGGRLVLRSPSTLVAKVLDITGVQSLVTLEDHPRVRPEPIETDAHQLADAIADSVVPLVDDALVEATMRLVVTLAERLGAADAASVTLRRRGRLVTVAATHAMASDFDQKQYDTGAGPCIEAATHGRAVHGHPGSDTSAWQALRQGAQQAGIHAVLSTPFLGGPELVGALNLYASGRDFNDEDGELASTLVGEAVRLLAIEPLDRQALSERLSQALPNRDRIARAQGIMMERHNLTAPQAHLRLLHDAAATGTFLTDTAAHAIADTNPADPPPPAADRS